MGENGEKLPYTPAPASPEPRRLYSGRYPTVGELGQLEDAGIPVSMSTRGGGGVPLNVGQMVGDREAQRLQGLGYTVRRVTGVPVSGGPAYTITSVPSAGGGFAGSDVPIPQQLLEQDTGTVEQEQEATRRLPPEIRPELLQFAKGAAADIGPAGKQYGDAYDFAAQEVRDLSPGYTPEEIEGMYIDANEQANLQAESGRPIAGAANAARSQLLLRSAARGESNPTAAIEEVQREQGRQAGEASERTRMNVMAQNREAARAIAAARIAQEQFSTGASRDLASLTANREAGIRSEAGATFRGFPETDTSQTGSTNTTDRTDRRSGDIGTLGTPGTTALNANVYAPGTVLVTPRRRTGTTPPRIGVGTGFFSSLPRNLP